MPTSVDKPRKSGSPSQGDAKVFGAYQLIWICLALVAISYLSVIAFQPGVANRITHKGPPTLDGFAARQPSQTSETINNITKDLEIVKQETIAQKMATSALNQRVTALETRLKKKQPNLAALPQDRASVPTTDDGAITANGQPASKEDGQLANPINTGSIARHHPPVPTRAPVKLRSTVNKPKVVRKPKAIRKTAAKPKATKVSKAPTKTFGIEIAAGQSLDALRLRWLELKARNAGSLKGMSPRYVLTNQTSGDPLRLVAGPVRGADRAKRICATIKASGGACRMTGYRGDPL